MEIEVEISSLRKQIVLHKSPFCFTLATLTYFRDIHQAFELGCLEDELLEFLLAHSVTSDQTMDFNFGHNMDR